jgi:glycosyltransferase involved in cell wall biosynthesis
MKTNRPIVQVCFSTAWGGLEMSSVKWARYFQQNGYSSIYITSKGAPSAEQARRDGITVFEWDEPRDYLSFGTRRNLRSFIEEHQPAAFFSHLTRDLWHLSPVLKKYPEIQLFNFARMFIRGIKKKDFLHRYIYSRLDKMITLSVIQKNFLLDALPLPNDRYIAIPNAVDVERFQPRPPNPQIRAELGAPQPNQLLVGLIGRLDPMKGHEEFVEATHLICSKHAHVQFVIVGATTAFEGSDYVNKVLKKISDSKLGDRLKVVPHRTDIPEVMNALDVFCMPSYEENFGNVLLEAMSSGTASVGCNSGGVPEIISEGHNGVLVSPKSGQALAGGILRLIEDSNFRKFVAQNGRSTVMDRYPISNVFTQVEALLK